jgi:tetratricopeptide (TPR) repeat protein
LLDLGRISLAEGAWARASRYLEECERMLRPSTDRNAVGEVASVLAERDLLKGHPEAARARLAPLLGPAGLQEKSVTYLGLRLAWALLDLDEVQPAADMVAQVVTRTRDEHRRLFLVDALRVQARVFLRQDHLEQARSALDEGIALAHAIGYPYAEARLLHVYGLLHIRNGEPKLAHERLEEALAIFRRLGARKDIERVEHLIAAPA